MTYKLFYADGSAAQGVQMVLEELRQPYELIQSIEPNILVKGGDYTVDNVVGSNEVISAGGKVKLLKFHDGYSSTNYIDKIKKH